MNELQNTNMHIFFYSIGIVSLNKFYIFANLFVVSLAILE